MSPIIRTTITTKVKVFIVHFNHCKIPSVISQLSIVICTYNRPKELLRCLKSLEQQTFKDFEVVIIDGNKERNYETKKLRNLKIKRFVYTEKELSKVRDLGWRKAQGEIVSWIDDDVVAAKNWAENIVKIFDQNPQIGGVTGPTIVPENFLRNRDIFWFYQRRGFLKILANFWNQFFLEGKMYQPGKLLKSGAWSPGSNFKECLKIKGFKEVDYLEACNMSLRRELVKNVNGFDFKYKGVAEWSELDLAIRVKNLGYRLVFSPKVKTAHFISQAGVFPRRDFAKLRMENFFKFYFRHIFKPKPNYIFKFLAYLCFLNFYWGYKAATTKNINWLSGWIGTIIGLKYIGKKYDS